MMGRFDFTSYSDTANGLKDKLVEAVCLQVVYHRTVTKSYCMYTSSVNHIQKALHV